MEKNGAEGVKATVKEPHDSTQFLEDAVGWQNLLKECPWEQANCSVPQQEVEAEVWRSNGLMTSHFCSQVPNQELNSRKEGKGHQVMRKSPAPQTLQGRRPFQHVQSQKSTFYCLFWLYLLVTQQLGPDARSPKRTLLMAGVGREKELLLCPPSWGSSQGEWRKLGPLKLLWTLPPFSNDRQVDLWHMCAHC